MFGWNNRLYNAEAKKKYCSTSDVNLKTKQSSRYIHCVSAYICRTKQWSFFFWYYYIQHRIEKTIYYGSKRATTKERELTCLLKMTFYILEFQRFLKKHYHERAIFYYQENINQRTGSFPTLILGVLAFSRVANVVMVHNNLLTRWRSI